MKIPAISLILLLSLTPVRVAGASTFADDFPAALSNYAYGGWQGPFGDGTAGRLFPTADGTGIYMDATYNGYVWALRSSPEFSDADMTVRFVLPTRDNTEADWFGLWMLAHNPITPPGGNCVSNCPFVVPESGLWLQFRVGFNQLVVTRYAGGVSVSSTTVPLPLVALNQPHDARAVYQGGTLIVTLDGVELLNWPAPNVPAGQVGFEVYRTDMIVDATTIVAGPGPPVLAAIANMKVEPGATADQGISARDPDGDAITFTSSGPAFMTLTSDPQVGNTRTGSIHLAPPLGTSGTFQASVTATANSEFDDQAFVITVRTNSPPTLVQPADMTVDEGATANQTITATDADGDGLSFAKVTGPTFLTVTTTTPGTGTATGNINLAPGFSDAGTVSATVVASDGSLTNDKTFTVTVNNVDRSPVLAVITNMSVSAGGTGTQGISASDPDGDAITFTASGPAFMTLSSNPQLGNTRTGTIQVTPPLGTMGTFPATVTATANGQFDDQGFTIFVGTNGPPTLAQPANMTVSDGATADQTLVATDPDGDALTFSKVSGPTFMTVTTTTITPPRGNVHLAPGFSDFGSSAATVSVSDGIFTDSKSFTINIAQCFGVPNLIQPANMTVAEGATADQVITGSDPCGNALTFTKVAGPTFMTVTTTNATTGNIHLAPGFSDAGTYAATVRASDGNLHSDKSLAVTIVTTNRAPVLAQPAPMTLNEGATADQNLTASDPDGDALTFSKVTGPFFMTVTTTNATTGNLHLAPPLGSSGTSSGSVRVSDGSLNDTKSVTITVRRLGNRCPVANAGGPYSGLAGVPVAFDGSGSADPDGDALTYSWDFDASDGVGIDAVGPTVSHVYASGGTFTVTLAVSDGACSSSATAAASILPFCPATVFNGYDVIRLGAGRPTWFAFVQPAGGCYVNTDVVLSSFVLSYAGRQIPADVTKGSIDSDKSGDGIQEIRVSFSKDNLRTLFSGTGLANGHNLVTVMVEANLTTGGALQGTTQVDVFNNGSFTGATVAPNPFNPSGTLAFTTSRPGPVKVELFDIAGRMVRTILDERSRGAGLHEVRIDGRGQRGEALASGIYFIRGVTADGEFRKAITILK